MYHRHAPASSMEGTLMNTLDPLTCDICDLKRCADQYAITCYIGTTGQLVIRPYRGPRPDIHAACVARHHELRDHLIATRPTQFDPEKAADDAAWRVCRMPYAVLVALAISELNRWLARADSGLLTYEPPLPPRWDDGLVHDDHEPRPKRRTRQQKQSPLPDRVVFG